MELLPFLPTAADVVVTWARTRSEVAAWCSHVEAPVPAHVVVEWAEEPEVTAYLLVEEAVPLGYGEIWVDAQEADVELARLIVAPDRRGRGVGRQLVRALVAEAHRRVSTVVMRVRPDNQAARHCYAGAGFTRVSAAEEEAWNRGQPVGYVWMRHTAG